MAYDETLAERLRKEVAGRRGIVEKQMFGGLGFLLNGNMCVGIWKEFLIVRLDPEEYAAALSETAVKEFDITGRPMAGWAMVGAPGVGGEKLKSWVERSVRYVKELPSKSKKTTKKVPKKAKRGKKRAR